MTNEEYWETIPIGRENSICYEALMRKWNTTKRGVRAILHDLSRMDNGDNYVLIRSSKGKGFYRTDNIHDIESYKRECENRARHIFATLKKARRICREIQN